MKFQPEARLEKVFNTLDLTEVLSKIPQGPKYGPTGYDRESMLRAVIAKEIEGIKKYNKLVERLKHDPVFRYNCGFPVASSTPSAATFSRFIQFLSENPLLEDILHEVVLMAKELGIIDGTHIAIDASKVESYDAAVPKSKIQQDGNQPDWGMKRDTDGNNIRWFGWKVHLAVDTKSELPVAVRVTPASTHDGNVALPLIEDIQKQHENIFDTTHYMMDMGYDNEIIYKTIRNKYHAQAIIPLNHRKAYAPPEGLDWDCTPVCSMGYRMVYWGHDNGSLKFRCPHVMKKVECPLGSCWCSSSNYGLVAKKKIDDNPRYFTYPHRGSEQWEKLYNERTSVERTFSRLKDHLGLEDLTLKGIAKTKAHALLSCIGLIAGTIAANIYKKESKAA